MKHYKHKTLIFCILSITLIGIGINQTHSNTQKNERKYRSSEELKLAAIQAKLDKRSKGWKKPDQPSEYVKYHNRIRTAAGQTSPQYRKNYKLTELNKAVSKTKFLKSTNTDLNWIERGPGNVSGRTRGLIIDPDDNTSNTWFCGSVAGGIWKTSNAGESWTNLTPNLPNLSTVCLAMAESNTKVIYAGTGEGFYNGDAIKGDGIFKSTDKGQNWTQLESTANNETFSYVNRLLVDPANENVVIAVTNTSIQKSTDGGTNWKTVYQSGFRRIQHIVADPTNFNTQYASSYGEGVLKSTDAGDTWQLVFQENTGRIELAIAPSNTDIIYALNENSQLYISNDAGISWAAANVTSGTNDLFLGSQGWYDNTLAVSPTDPDLVFIGGVNLYKAEVLSQSATSSTIFTITTDDMDYMSFTRFGGNYLAGGMDIDDTKDNYTTIEIQYGPGKSQLAHRFYVPVGATSGVPSTSHTYQDYVEVPFEVWDIENNRQLMVSFRDQDRNGKWNLTEYNDDLLIGREYIWINDVTYSNSQSEFIAKTGGYEFDEIAFWWPYLTEGYSWDENNVPNSKITIKRTEVYPYNLRSTKVADWAGQGAPYVHADLHNIQFTNKANGATRLIVTNDGGVGYSDNFGTTWTNPSNGYNTTQFYGVDKHPTQNRYIGGLQDNGSWVSATDPNNLSKWVETTGGDGFDAVWHATDPEKLISTIYNNALYLSADGGNTWGSINSFEDEGTGKAPFVTQIGYSPIAPDKLYITGVSGVTYSDDFGSNWYVSNMQGSEWNWNGDSYVEPSHANPNVVWAASNMSEYGSIYVSTDGGKNFVPTNNFNEAMGTLTGLATHPLDENTAYALFSFADKPKILRTTNMGESWEDISAFEGTESTNGFPNVATYCLFVMPHNPEEIWAGTEIGLFTSSDNGQNWQYANNGLPAVSIWEIKARSEQVIVATHGRGVWTVDIPEISTALKNPTLLSAGTTPMNQTIITYSLESEFDSIQVYIDDTSSQTLYNPSTEQNILKLEVDLEETAHTIQFIAYKNGRNLKSATKEFNSINYNEAQTSYSNSFDSEPNDFTGNGFEIKSIGSFGTGMAIHSKHPYDNNSNVSYYLKTPIIVEQNANSVGTHIYYNDIPFIEEGTDNTAYGDVNFYDYVVVEASKNGYEWIALGDGYDFGKVKFMASIQGKTIEDTPLETMFIDHAFDFTKNFNIGDTVAIRFRLFADTYSNGWGWVIDDIEIRAGFKTQSKNDISINLSVYPIPCNETLNINVSQELFNADVTIYNVNGQIIHKTKTNENLHLTINTSNFSEGNYILKIQKGKNITRRKFRVIH